MIYKFRVIILTFIMCFFMTETTHSSYLYYYIEENNDVILAKKEINIEGDNLKSKIKTVIEMLIYDETTLCIPENTTLINVNIIEDRVILNFDENILKHGGNFYERVLLNQIFENVLQFDEIKSVTILINGENIDFPEGQNLSKTKKRQ